MKTAYELAMERLGKASPPARLSDDQKKALAELDAVYKAKTAEREIALDAELAKAEAQGDSEAMEKIRQQMAGERRKLQADLEDKKEQVRKG
jgi:hypothetical protein